MDARAVLCYSRLFVAALFMACSLSTAAQTTAPNRSEFEHVTTDVLDTSDGVLLISILGHAAVMYRYQGKVIHVDPVSEFIDTDLDQLPKADLILITHEHRDHLDTEAIKRLSKEDTLVVASRDSATALPDAQIMLNGEKRTFAGVVEVEAIPAYSLDHFAEATGKLHHPPGSGNSYLLTFADKRIIMAGDGGEVKELNALRDIDIAFLPMNLRPERSARIMVDTVRQIQPKILYPHHFGDLGPDEAIEMLQGEPVEIRIRNMY